MLRICKGVIRIVILSEAKDLLSYQRKRQHILRFAQDDKCDLRQELQSGLNPGSWVEKVAQRIADKVEGENREHYCDCREEHQMRSIEKV